MKRTHRTIPEGANRFPKREAPKVIMKNRSPISLVSRGEAIQWMAPARGALNNVILFVKAEQPSVVNLRIEVENGDSNRQLEVKPGNNALPSAISVAKGDRLTLSFPEGASEMWLAAVFGEAE